MLNRLLLLCLILTCSACSKEICGTVKSEDGNIIEGARVGWQTETKRVLTDNKGFFCINSSEKNHTIAAWANGFIIGGIEYITDDTHTITLTPLPKPTIHPKDHTWFDSIAHDNKTYPSLTAQTNEPCSACHPRLSKEWQQSAHGNSHHNKSFHALLNLIPESRQQKCHNCHNPQVTKAPHANRLPIGCDYCHKIKDVETHNNESFGSDRIQHHIPENGALAFGQLDDPVGRIDYFEPLYGKSEYCSACHEASFWHTPIYSTYSEWQSSPQAKQNIQCQDCHMQTRAQFSASVEHGGKQRKSQTLSSHDFQSNIDQLRNAINFNLSHTQTADKITLSIHINNIGAAHDLPSGNPNQHMILVVTALNEQGKALNRLSGTVLPKWSLHAGESGAVLGKILAAKTSYKTAQLNQYPSAFWLPSVIESDTRLKALTEQVHSFHFSSDSGYKIKVQLWQVSHYASWKNLPTPTPMLVHEIEQSF